MKIRAIIVDDEKLARDVIRIMLKEHKDVEMVSECKNGREAIKVITSEQPDLVFLDVQMPGINGFRVIKEVGVTNMPVVIFVTAFDQYALKAFEVHALDYLLKPFDQERFDESLNRAIGQIKNAKSAALSGKIHALIDEFASPKERKRKLPDYPDRLLIKEAGRIFFVKTGDIRWIEAAGDYMNLHIGKKSHLLHDTMNNLEKKLDPAKFIRIHRSTMVNIDFVKELYPHGNGEYFIILQNDIRLKLSRSYRQRLTSVLGNQT